MGIASRLAGALPAPPSRRSVAAGARSMGKRLVFVLAVLAVASALSPGLASAVVGSPGTGAGVNGNGTASSPGNTSSSAGSSSSSGESGTAGTGTGVNGNGTSTTTSGTSAGTGAASDTDTQGKNTDVVSDEQLEEVKENVEEATEGKREEVDPSEIGPYKISEAVPKFDLTKLSYDFFTTSFACLIYDNFVSFFVGWMCDCISFFLGILDAATSSLFTFEFSTGAFSEFYRVAEVINDRVAVPVGTALLGLSFGVGLVRAMDPRQRVHGFEHAQVLVSQVLLYAVGFGLVTHALDIVAGVYWVGGKVVSGATKGLAELGVGGGGADMASSVTSTLRTSLESVTYDSAGSMWGLTLIALVALAVSVGCMVYTLSVAFLRAGEIYLRAGFSAVALAFVGSDATRPMGWGWIKRLGAVCVQAGVIIAALGMAGLLFEVSQSCITPLLSDGGPDYVRSLVPSIVALSCMTGLVKKSEQISAGLFGLA